MKQVSILRVGKQALSRFCFYVLTISNDHIFRDTALLQWAIF